MNQVKLVGIVGAGQMGRGIAQVCAMHGVPVKLFDTSEKALEDGMSFIRGKLDKGLNKGKWDQDYVLKTVSLLEKVNEVNMLEDCDLVIEAATENKTIKEQILRDLSKVTKKTCILATNTSSIPITDLASITDRPDKVVGMHFMNPVPVMKLVEGIKGLETSEETFSIVRALTEKIGKRFVVSKDMPGFVVNRILMPMINEAVYALYEGLTSVEDIDEAMKLGTNQPMGPLELADFIGLDTCLAIMEVLFEGFSDTKYRPCPLLRQYVSAGRLGRKTGKGFYEY